MSTAAAVGRHEATPTLSVQLNLGATNWLRAYTAPAMGEVMVTDGGSASVIVNVAEALVAL